MSTIKRRKRSGYGLRGRTLIRPEKGAVRFHLLTWVAFAMSMLLMFVLRWLTQEEPQSQSEEVTLVDDEACWQIPGSDSWRPDNRAQGLILNVDRIPTHIPVIQRPRGLAVVGGLLAGLAIYAFFGVTWSLYRSSRSIPQTQLGVEAAGGVAVLEQYVWPETSTAEIHAGRSVISSPFSDEPALSPAQNQSGSFMDWGFEEKQQLASLRSLPMLSSVNSFYEPAGCRQPAEDEGWLSVGAWRLPLRSIRMLEHAAELYGARLDLSNSSLTSTSLRSGINTLDIRVHRRTVKISMTYPGSRHVLYNEVDPLVTALRVAGFAAWYQEGAEGEGAQILAIAIGDPGLPHREKELLYGDFGYFHGYLGVQDGEPVRDPHGGPVVCDWMIEKGYSDTFQQGPDGHGDDQGIDWRERLRSVAEGFITHSSEQTIELAKRLGYLGGTYEHPSNMCGPLTAAILLEADLIPSSVGPIRDPKSFWLSNPKLNGRPWMFFPADEYEVFRWHLPLNYFRFEDWPLCAGDIVFTYAGNGEFSHVFVVTEVDELGRVYTVTNQAQAEGVFLVERLLLYGLGDNMSGVFRNVWSNDAVIGRTGLGGFEVLRRKGVCLQPGALHTYVVRPGDTLGSLAERFSTTVEAIRKENRLPQETRTLEVGQELIIPVNAQQVERASGG